MTLFETLRNVLPRSLFTHLGEPPSAIEVPARVAALIRAREEESERLIGWVQLVMAATFAALYVIAPRPLDAGMMLVPVPLALTCYATFTAARLWLAHRRYLPGWLLVLSILVDTALLLGLIWAFHIQYEVGTLSEIAHSGVVDKFLGDGVMATFGVVMPSKSAAADALRALDAIMEEAERWRKTLPGVGVAVPLEVNGAVSAGPVVFATLGGGDRLEYTVIGEAVNLAAKLEKHNKSAGTRALTSAATYELAVAQGYGAGREFERRAGSMVASLSEPLDLVVLKS